MNHHNMSPKVVGDAQPEERQPGATYAGLRAQILADPGTRFWVRDAIGQLEQRDLVDALEDIELVHRLLSLRLAEINQDLQNLTAPRRLGA